MPSFTQAELNTSCAKKVSGEYSASDFLVIANDAIKDILSGIDLRSSKRKSALSPNLLDDVYQYSLPSDIKGDKIVDIKPQINRSRYDDWRLTTPEEFDRLKENYRVDKYGDPIDVRGVESTGENLVAISRDDLVNKLLISKAIDDTETVITALDVVGDWEGFGDGENLTADSDNYVKGSASVNWDINADGGTTAGIQNTSLDEFDVEPYKSVGYAFVWVYISSVTNLTNFILRVGSSASAYYSITITTNNEGNSFHAGWNLLRFSFSGKSTTGTPSDATCNYIALYMTKDGAKVSETDYRLDNLILKLGDHYDVVYYSRYLWQSSAGTFLEDATTTTDLINCETDEMNLFILKCASLIEESLKNISEADRLEIKYERAKQQYIKENPSQALVMISTYYEV